MELAKPIFLVAQASATISPNCHQQVTSNILPLTNALIQDFIAQPLDQNQAPTEFSIAMAIINVTNGKCPLWFINNMPNSIKLGPNPLVAITKHTLESVAVQKPDSHNHVSVATSDHDFTNHKHHQAG
uniref:Uncharacterized protein n=1 Tax=Romanomermis culicivorax TaxID=13658 RepID=A0A915HPE8_ROMCU